TLDDQEVVVALSAGAGPVAPRSAGWFHCARWRPPQLSDNRGSPHSYPGQRPGSRRPDGRTFAAVQTAAAEAWDRLWRSVSAAATGTTVTGHGACSTHCRLTEPSVMLANPPRPRLPTTSR